MSIRLGTSSMARAGDRSRCEKVRRFRGARCAAGATRRSLLEGSVMGGGGPQRVGAAEHATIAHAARRTGNGPEDICCGRSVRPTLRAPDSEPTIGLADPATPSPKFVPDGVVSSWMLTVAQAAALAGVGEETVRRWVRAGRLPAHRDGPRLLVAAEDVSRLATPAVAAPARRRGSRRPGASRSPTGSALLRRSRATPALSGCWSSTSPWRSPPARPGAGSRRSPTRTSWRRRCCGPRARSLLHELARRGRAARDPRARRCAGPLDAAPVAEQGHPRARRDRMGRRRPPAHRAHLRGGVPRARAAAGLPAGDARRRGARPRARHRARAGAGRAVRIAAAVFDVGETLVDETRAWQAWADALGVPRLTLLGALGGLAARRGEHHRGGVRPGRARRRPRGGGGAARGDRLRGVRPVSRRAAVPARAARPRPRRRGLRQPARGDARRSCASSASRSTSSARRSAGASRSPTRRSTPASPPSSACRRQRSRTSATASTTTSCPARAAGLVAVHLRRGPWGVLQARWPEAAQAHVALDGLAGLPDALDRDRPTVSRR